MSRPGHDQLVRGLGRWAAACELAHILDTFPGTYTHLFWQAMMSSGKGACTMLSMLSLAARSWALLTAVCCQLL